MTKISLQQLINAENKLKDTFFSSQSSKKNTIFHKIIYSIYNSKNINIQKSDSKQNHHIWINQLYSSQIRSDFKAIQKSLVSLGEIKTQIFGCLMILIPTFTLVIILPLVLTIINFFTIFFRQIINVFYYKKYKQFYFKLK